MEDVGINMLAKGESKQVAKGGTLEGNDLLCGERRAQIENSEVSVEIGEVGRERLDRKEAKAIQRSREMRR